MDQLKTSGYSGFSDVTYEKRCAVRASSFLSCASRRRRTRNCGAHAGSDGRATPQRAAALFPAEGVGRNGAALYRVFDIPEMLGRGDAATAWVTANLASHHRNVSLFDMKAQEEVWGDNRDAGISSGIAFAQGRAVRADGGLMVSGQWSFSSGTDHAQWNQLAFTVREGDKPVDWVYCLMHESQYEVVDDWHVLGMRATSSKTVRCEDVFVPAHRIISMYWSRPGHAWPGLSIHKNPHYRIQLSAVGGNGLGGCLIGNAVLRSTS